MDRLLLQGKERIGQVGSSAAGQSLVLEQKRRRQSWRDRVPIHNRGVSGTRSTNDERSLLRLKDQKVSFAWSFYKHMMFM